MGVAVVTGGSRGIGAATARLLAARGWDLCITYRDRAEEAAAVVGACRANGTSAVAVRADVAVEADVLDVFAAADELGPLTVLVNNAGIVGQAARVDVMGAARIDRLLAVNVLGSILCAREAVRRMSTTHGGAGGAIVNVGSAASRLGSPGEYVDYAATKGAIDSFTVGLAREVAAEGVRVNCVRPGFIETEIHASGGQPDRLRRVLPGIPAQRSGQPEEVAETIAWLCSDAASYVTAALVDVSGGR